MTHSKKIKKSRTKIFLYSIFLITVIPTIILYFEHAYVEFIAANNKGTETGFIKASSEGVLFFVIAWGYLITTALIFAFPNKKILYLIVIIGTVAIIYLWLFRIYGIPVPGRPDIVITDFSTDWRDVISKACQTVILVASSMLLVLVAGSRKDKLTKC